MLDGQVCCHGKVGGVLFAMLDGQVCCCGKVDNVPFAMLDGQVCCRGKVGGVLFAMLDGQVCCHGKVDNVPFAMLDGQVCCRGKVDNVPFAMLDGQVIAMAKSAVHSRRDSALPPSFSSRSSGSVPNSVQFKMVSVHLEKPLCAPACLSEVCPTLPLKQLGAQFDITTCGGGLTPASFI